jgi:hypothetical protein
MLHAPMHVGWSCFVFKALWWDEWWIFNHIRYLAYSHAEAISAYFWLKIFETSNSLTCAWCSQKCFTWPLLFMKCNRHGLSQKCELGVSGHSGIKFARNQCYLSSYNSVTLMHSMVSHHTLLVKCYESKLVNRTTKCLVIFNSV